MPVLSPTDRRAVQQRISDEVKRDVEVTLYTFRQSGLIIPGRECRQCGPMQDFLEDVVSLSPHLKLEIRDYFSNQQEAHDRGIDRIPAVTLGRGGTAKVRFFGVPTDMQLPVFLEALVIVAGRKSSLKIDTRRKLRRLQSDVRVRVFVTPHCRFSPPMAHMAISMAMESPNVMVDIVQTPEFPDLTALYGVMGTPKVVLNGKVQFTGAAPEETFIRRVRQAAGDEPVSPDNESAHFSNLTTPLR